MEIKKITAKLVVEEQQRISFVQICEQYSIPKEELVEMIEYGLISANRSDIQQSNFDYQTLLRIQSACRLKHDLGMNMPGIALAIELLEKLEQTQDELEILKRHVRNI